MIYNLFKNFGFITKILHNKEKKYAFVEFKSPDSANLSKEYMDNLIFYNSQLKVIKIIKFIKINKIRF